MRYLGLRKTLERQLVTAPCSRFRDQLFHATTVPLFVAAGRKQKKITYLNIFFGKSMRLFRIASSICL